VRVGPLGGVLEQGECRSSPHGFAAELCELRRTGGGHGTSRWIETVQRVPPCGDTVRSQSRNFASARRSRSDELYGGRAQGVRQELFKMEQVEGLREVAGRSVLQCVDRNRRRIVACHHKNWCLHAHLPQ
jgi:hypothetical protein